MPLKPPPPPAQTRPRWSDLSFRQAEVATALAHGANNHEIAEKAGIGVKTVDTHRQAVMKKLGLRNNAELVLFAVSEGIVAIDRAKYVSTDVLRDEIRDAYHLGQQVAPPVTFEDAEAYAVERLRAILP